MGAVPGHGCRAAGDASAERPRGGQALPRPGRAARRVSEQRAEAGQRGTGLGRGAVEARGARGLRWAGLRGWAGKEAAAQEK